MNFNWLNQIIKRKGPFILCLYFVSGLQLAICSRHFLLTNRSFYRLFRNSYLRCIIKHGLTSNLTCVFKHLKLFEMAALIVDRVKWMDHELSLLCIQYLKLFSADSRCLASCAQDVFKWKDQLQNKSNIMKITFPSDIRSL